jgi:hypothetical protein
MFVSCVCCVLCKWPPLYELIARSEKFSWMCVYLNACGLGTSTRRRGPDLGCGATERNRKKKVISTFYFCTNASNTGYNAYKCMMLIHIYIYIYIPQMKRLSLAALPLTPSILLFLMGYNCLFRSFRFKPTFSETQLGRKTGVSVPPLPQMPTWRKL